MYNYNYVRIGMTIILITYYAYYIYKRKILKKCEIETNHLPQLYEEKNYIEADRITKYMVQHFPRSILVLCRITYLMEYGDFESMFRIIKQKRKIFYKTPEYLIYVLKCEIKALFFLNRLQEAREKMEELNRSIEDVSLPGSEPTLFVESINLYHEDEYELSRKGLEKKGPELELHSDKIIYAFYLSRIYRIQGMEEKAEEYLRKAKYEAEGTLYENLIASDVMQKEGEI
jgi:tetratricopeptide (TPR) repeat protein